MNNMVCVLLLCGCPFAGSAVELALPQTASGLNPANVLKQRAETFLGQTYGPWPKESLIFASEIKPVVELASRSHMSFDQRLHRAYLSGTLSAQVNGAELTSRMPVTNIVALIEGLQKLGFFELSESGIKKRIDEVRERTGKGLAVCDYGTDTLTVRYQGRENTVSWYAIESYADRYPEVEELRKQRGCFELVNRVLIGPLRP